MAILNYTTSVDAKKTVAEIQEKLSKARCKRIITDYDDEGNPSSISFSVEWNDALVFFQLPCNHEAVLRAMIKSKDVPNRFCTKDQAYRVSWRIIKDWTEAQLAIVEADQAKLQQVFLPYSLTTTGETLYERVSKDNSQLLIQ